MVGVLVCFDEGPLTASSLQCCPHTRIPLLFHEFMIHISSVDLRTACLWLLSHVEGHGEGLEGSGCEEAVKGLRDPGDPHL